MDKIKFDKMEGLMFEDNGSYRKVYLHRTKKVSVQRIEYEDKIFIYLKDVQTGSAITHIFELFVENNENKKKCPMENPDFIKWYTQEFENNNIKKQEESHYNPPYIPPYPSEFS